MVSLRSYRRAIAVELGPLVVNTVTTGGSDLVSFTCASLVSGNASGAQFQGGWVYLTAATGPNLSAQRAILTAGGYDPDAGSVTVARSWSTSVTSTTGFEIHSRMPAITDELGETGIREIVNEVLSTLPAIDLLPVTGVTGQSAYDVTTPYPWLTEKGQILGIYYQDTNDDYPKPRGYAWDWEYDADAPRLLLPSEPFLTGQTFYLKVARVAQSWIKTAGTWASDTDGLQDDPDEALPLLQIVRAQSLVTCYRMLGKRQGPDTYRSYCEEREVFWTKRAYALRWWQDQQADEDTTPRVRMAWPGTPYGTRKAYR